MALFSKSQQLKYGASRRVAHAHQPTCVHFSGKDYVCKAEDLGTYLMQAKLCGAFGRTLALMQYQRRLVFLAEE
jgi:hypothetical protein